MIRLTTLFVVVFAIFSFGAVEHGKVFQITESAKNYSANDNYFDSANPGVVRFSYTPTKTGSCRVSTSNTNYSFSRYLNYYGTDDSFSTRINYDYGSYTSSYAFICAAGKTYYFTVSVTYSSDYSDVFDIKVVRQDVSIVSVEGKTSPDTVLLNTSFSISAPVKTGEHFVEWKIESGKGSFGNSKSISTSFTPSSEKASLKYETEKGKVYTLTDKFVPYTYESDGSMTGNSLYGIRAAFKPKNTAQYALITKAAYSRYVYFYGEDSKFSTSTSSVNHGATVSRSVYSLTAGEKYYFMLNQKAVSYYGDTVSVRIAETYKVNSDTLGNGYVYVGEGSRNYDSSYVAKDSVPIRAYSRANMRFAKWEKVSGKCSIVDKNLAHTKVVIEGDCKVRAVFEKGKVYQITEKPVKYTPLEHYYSGSPSDGVRFFFVAPADGGYLFKYEKDSTEWSYLKRYKTGAFSSYALSKNTTQSFADTLKLSAGDSVFYLVSNEYWRDSLMSFSMSYESIPILKLDVESSSPKCSTSVDTLDGSLEVFKGSVVYVEAYAKEGYRPDGWKVVKGSQKFMDSTTYFIRDTIDADTKIKLNCRKSKVIDITETPQTFNPYNDYYEKDPGSGMRFRFEAPKSGMYVLRFLPFNLYGSYYDYAADSSFTTVNRSFTYNEKKASFRTKSLSAGDRIYASVIPYSSRYWGDSVSVVAVPVAIVKTVGAPRFDTTRTDSVAIGDTIRIFNTVLDTNENFVKWTVTSGKGTFVDSSARSTQFIPASAPNIKIKMVTRTLPIYELTDVFKGFVYNENSSYTRYGYYGIRTKFIAPDSGTYAVIVKPSYNSKFLSYAKDSTFNSSVTSYTCSTPYCKLIVNAKSGESLYFLMSQNYEDHMKDSVWARVQKTVYLRTDTAGIGYAYVGSGSRMTDSTYVPGDTVPLRAYTGTIGFKFSKWTVVSGSCKILDPAKPATAMVVKGDCKVKAHFVLGTKYEITDVATKYTNAESYYSRSAVYGTRFFFVAPKTGKYAFVFTSLKSLAVERYLTGSFSSYDDRFNGYTNKEDTLTLNAGDSLFYNVMNYANRDSLEPFWVNYSQKSISITLLADSNGSVSPSAGYPNAWANAAYPISATPDSMLRFDRWKIESGKGTIEDPLAKKTVVIPEKSIKVKAYFRSGDVYSLTNKEQIFNFEKHYYSESKKNTILFSWTPKDTNHYLLELDSAKGGCVLYGKDSLFEKETGRYVLDSGVTYVHLQGKPGETYYLSVYDTVKTMSRNLDFKAKIIVPSVLYVESSRGRTLPSDYIYVAPGTDTSLYVIPYGGYIFDSWTKVSGTVKIDSVSNPKIKVELQSDSGHIKANYKPDSAAVPELTITNLDISNHPGICAQVSVVDKRTGRPFAGLDSSDFVLFQDTDSPFTQTTTIESFGGVSVALVVDESGSMDNNNRMENAKKAIRQFINEMGPYDRTAIVGFTGGSNAYVRQAMTSDKSLLLKATDRLDATGGTNINTGAKLGVDQVVGETNPTAVILFSDGDNDTESITTAQVVNQAVSLNTSIYTIGLETIDNKVLIDLAEGSGGTYTYAPNASQLTSIYSDIRGTVQSRYILCYQTPDITWNGDKHMVEIKTTFLGKDVVDTAYWNEDAPPPVVELTPATWKLVGSEQPQNKSLTIDVYVRAKKDLSDVRLYAKNVDLANGVFKSYKMTRENDSLWRYVIPDSMVQYPGIDFYVVATDLNGLTGKTPAVTNPSKEPYTIPVKNDVPVIKMDSLACVDTVGGKGTLRFKITDKNKIDNASLFYKDSMTVLFDESEMTLSGGYWNASIPSKAFENGVIEFYVRAVDGVGASARWPKKENSWIQVCGRKYRAPDVKDVIEVVSADTSHKTIGRETEKLKLTLVTEDFSNLVDTVTVKLSCLVSGDAETNIKLVEKRSGYYETRKSIPKNEQAVKKDDGSISCSGRDTLVAEYKDPLYNTYARDTVIIGDSVAFGYKFLDYAGKKDLESVETGDSAKFQIRLTAFSKSIHVKDTLDVLLLTDKGDSLWVKAVETGNYSSTFEYRGMFNFVYNKKDLSGSKLDALFDLTSSHNRVSITAKMDGDNLGKKRDSLIIYSNYIPADIAEIYDTDKDGRADSIRIHFIQPNKDGVEGIDTLYWNKAGGAWISVPKKRLRSVDGGSWFEAQLKEPFAYGATSADAAKTPYLKLTRPKGGFSQKVLITDRIGAVPVKALKRPGVIAIDDYLECSDEMPPDTLEITLSEPVKSKKKGSEWKQLFAYSASCKDSAEHSLNISNWIKTDSTGRVWTFVLGDHKVITGNCIRANTESPYFDAQKNSMGRGEVEIEGDNGDLYLYEVAPAPTVSGIDTDAEWIAPDDNEWSRVPDTLSVIRVSSIMPYKAYVTIYDGLSNVVASFTRNFGDKGEMNEKIRANDGTRAKTGFLHWNNRSDSGRKVGTGVYIWRIDFKFKDGHSEFRMVRTGVKRKK